MVKKKTPGAQAPAALRSDRKLLPVIVSLRYPYQINRHVFGWTQSTISDKTFYIDKARPIYDWADPFMLSRMAAEGPRKSERLGAAVAMMVASKDITRVLFCTKDAARKLAGCPKTAGVTVFEPRSRPVRLMKDEVYF